jgi:hypothetical protein
MDKDLYGVLALDSRVRGNDKNDKSIGYDMIMPLAPVR